MAMGLVRSLSKGLDWSTGGLFVARYPLLL